MDTLLRFEQFENRIERMEAEAELAGPWAGAPNDREAGLHDRFSALEVDEDIEKELAELKAKTAGATEAAPDAAPDAAPAAEGKKAAKKA